MTLENTDRRIARLVAQLNEQVKLRQWERRHPRTMPLGRRQMEKMSTGRLVREHVENARVYKENYPDNQRRPMEREFERRGLPETASAIGAGLIPGVVLGAAAANTDWGDSFKSLSDKAEAETYPSSLLDRDVAEGVDSQIAQDSESQQAMSEVVDTSSYTQDDFVADMAENGVHPEVVDNFEMASQFAPNDLDAAVGLQHDQSMAMDNTESVSLGAESASEDAAEL